jgi:hypothetical protein
VSRYRSILKGLYVMKFIGKGSEWQTTRTFLHGRKNVFCRLLKLHGIYNVRNVEICLIEPGAFEKTGVSRFL